jgi:hypothetical protein
MTRKYSAANNRTKIRSVVVLLPVVFLGVVVVVTVDVARIRP